MAGPQSILTSSHGVDPLNFNIETSDGQLGIEQSFGCFDFVRCGHAAIPTMEVALRNID